MRVRKKPVEVEAIQWTGNNFPEIEVFSDFRVTRYRLVLSVYTLEGVMYAKVGDYIIKGVKGEVYPCKPDIFAETYEPVSESPKPDWPKSGCVTIYRDPTIIACNVDELVTT